MTFVLIAFFAFQANYSYTYGVTMHDFTSKDACESALAIITAKTGHDAVCVRK